MRKQLHWVRKPLFRAHVSQRYNKYNPELNRIFTQIYRIMHAAKTSLRYPFYKGYPMGVFLICFGITAGTHNKFFPCLLQIVYERCLLRELTYYQDSSIINPILVVDIRVYVCACAVGINYRKVGQKHGFFSSRYSCSP